MEIRIVKVEEKRPVSKERIEDLIRKPEESDWLSQLTAAITPFVRASTTARRSNRDLNAMP